MKKVLSALLGVWLILVSAGCEEQNRAAQIPPAPQQNQDAQTPDGQGQVSTAPLDVGGLVAGFNLGAAYLEQYQYHKAADAFEAVLAKAPDWQAARFNLGLAYLNMQEENDAQVHLKKAKEMFEIVLDNEPDHASALYTLGMYYQHLGELEKTLECFKAVFELDSENPHVLFKYAEALSSLEHLAESTRLLEKVIEMDPGFLSGTYKLALQYRRLKRMDESMALFKRFEALRSAELTAGTFAVNKPYGSAGKYYMALGADNLPLPAPAVDSPRMLFSPKVLSLDVTLKPWKTGAEEVAMPGMACGDVDGDGDLDLCLTASGEGGEASIWLNDGAGVFSKGAVVGQKGISPSFGDVDNDGDLDLWLGCAGPDRFYENDGKGGFKAATPGAIAEAKGLTACARLVDVDSDGDLDYLAFAGGQSDGPAANRFFNNNRDGTFADVAEKIGLALPGMTVAAAIYDDFDNDRDLDWVLFPNGDGGAMVWANHRVWKYGILPAEKTGLAASKVISALSGDPDKDGDRDILVFSEGKVRLFKNTGGMRFIEDAGFAGAVGPAGGTGGQFADMDNDGDLDLVISDARRRDGSIGPALFINNYPKEGFVDAAQVDAGIMLSAIKTGGRTSCVVADFTGDGKCDIFLAPMGEKPFLIKNETKGGNWIAFDLAGTRTKDDKTRSNNSAIGARVEVKTGRIFQQHTVGVPSGSVAMPPFRVHMGLGDCTKVDWLRIVWPDAVLQAELELPANVVTAVEELQRKTSSCPLLYAWDGTRFALVSDFNGVGGLGYFIAPDTYAKPDPTEYIKIPKLAPLNGEYVLQVLENLEEVVYLDEAKLIAVDHPEGTTVYPNEMMAINAKPPAYEVFCYEKPIDPVKAVDHRGKDVTALVTAIDRQCAGATDLSPPFMGVAGAHSVELDFGEGLKALKPDARLVLFLYGWVEYGYSSTNFAASQAGVALRAPTISAERDGQWVELFKEVGYPAGFDHMMTLDVTGKVKPGDRKLRIESNMELFWDRIFLAEVLGQDVIRQQEVQVGHADLHFKGYPREYTPDGRHPNLYDYHNIDTAVAWKLLSGDYTRFGDVTELLHEPDDCYAIMGRGEEVTLRFPVKAFGPVPAGKTRSFILKSDGFCKDMDLYTAYPDTVEPLPFHGMSGYPYGKDEQYPDTEKTRAYRRKYNTRRIDSGIAVHEEQR